MEFYILLSSLIIAFSIYMGLSQKKSDTHIQNLKAVLQEKNSQKKSTNKQKKSLDLESNKEQTKSNQLILKETNWEQSEFTDPSNFLYTTNEIFNRFLLLRPSYHLLIVGNYGAGKTTLATWLMNELKTNYQTINIWLSSEHSKEAFLEATNRENKPNLFFSKAEHDIDPKDIIVSARQKYGSRQKIVMCLDYVTGFYSETSNNKKQPYKELLKAAEENNVFLILLAHKKPDRNSISGPAYIAKEVHGAVVFLHKDQDNYSSPRTLTLNGAEAKRNTKAPDNALDNLLVLRDPTSEQISFSIDQNIPNF